MALPPHARRRLRRQTCRQRRGDQAPGGTAVSGRPLPAGARAELLVAGALPGVPAALGRPLPPRAGGRVLCHLRINPGGTAALTPLKRSERTMVSTTDRAVGQRRATA